MAPETTVPNTIRRTSVRRPLIASLMLAACCVLPGCTLLSPQAGGDLTARSSMGERTLSPNFITAAYVPVDENTADVYLSDLPEEAFGRGVRPMSSLSGSIVHVHVFLMPSAGDTPIDTTAVNVTLRHLILAGAPARRGATDTPLMGLYAGGGFWYPRGDIGDDTLSGSLDGASHRLSRATPGFADPLGSGSLSGSVVARRDETLAQAMAATLDALLRRLPAPAIEPAAADGSGGKAEGGPRADEEPSTPSEGTGTGARPGSGAAPQPKP